eukprot:439776_1
MASRKPLLYCSCGAIGYDDNTFNDKDNNGKCGTNINGAHSYKPFTNDAPPSYNEVMNTDDVKEETVPLYSTVETASSTQMNTALETKLNQFLQKQIELRTCYNVDEFIKGYSDDIEYQSNNKMATPLYPQEHIYGIDSLKNNLDKRTANMKIIDVEIKTMDVKWFIENEIICGSYRYRADWELKKDNGCPFSCIICIMGCMNMPIDGYSEGSVDIKLRVNDEIKIFKSINSVHKGRIMNNTFTQ